jgi:hypothetical protein
MLWSARGRLRYGGRHIRRRSVGSLCSEVLFHHTDMLLVDVRLLVFVVRLSTFIFLRLHTVHPLLTFR